MCNITHRTVLWSYKWYNLESPLEDCRNETIVLQKMVYQKEELISLVQFNLMQKVNGTLTFRYEAENLKLRQLRSSFYGSCYELNFIQDYEELVRSRIEGVDILGHADLEIYIYEPNEWFYFEDNALGKDRL